MRIKNFNKSYIFLWVLILVSLYQYSLVRNNFISNLHNKYIDFFLRYRYAHTLKPNIINDFVIISIDDESLEKGKEPIDRKLYGSLLNSISGANISSKIIGLTDSVFVSLNNQGAEDAVLSQALKKFGNIIIASYLTSDGRLINPDSLLSESALDVGFINYYLDDDLVVRRSYPFTLSEYEPMFNFSFAFKMYARLKGFNLKSTLYDREKKVLCLYPYTSLFDSNDISLDYQGNTLTINYFSKFSDFKVVPLWKILNSWEPPDTFKDKIVLVGTTFALNSPIYNTPLGVMPPVCINANILMSLLQRRFLVKTPLQVNFLMLLIISLVISFVTYFYGNLRGFILSAATVLVSFYISAITINYDIIFDFFGVFLISLVSFVAMTSFKYLAVVLENTSLRRLATTDGLTGLYVYRYFEVKLNSELRRAIETQTDIALVILDIDHFKKFNDTYGHDVGNELLKSISLIMQEHSRPSDTVARFGGEEFAVILPQTDMEGAYKYAEGIRNLIEDFKLMWQNRLLGATISAGVSSLSVIARKTAADLMKSADVALYEAKAMGRNIAVRAKH